MSWAVGVGPCDQGEVLDELKTRRDENDATIKYTEAVKKQQDAVFKAVDQLLSSATFEGKKVSVNASGHVPGEEDDYRTTSVGINIHNLDANKETSAGEHQAATLGTEELEEA